MTFSSRLRRSKMTRSSSCCCGPQCGADVQKPQCGAGCDVQKPQCDCSDARVKKDDASCGVCYKDDGRVEGEDVRRNQDVVCCGRGNNLLCQERGGGEEERAAASRASLHSSGSEDVLQSGPVRHSCRGEARGGGGLGGGGEFTATAAAAAPTAPATAAARGGKSSLLPPASGRAAVSSPPAKTAVLGLVMVLCSHLGLVASQSSALPPPCDSNIYCHGDLLKTVQLAHLHQDSKHFVDMTLKLPPDQVYAAFQQLMDGTDNQPTKEQVQSFVSANFNDPGSEFEAWQPDDWLENPPFLSGVKDPQLQAWGGSLHSLWKELGRKISTAVKDAPDQYSQLYVDRPVVVPGGRFREFYYWDSYWTIDGLLLSGMTGTVKGMLENFLQMVRQFGMVPNGGRVYYTRRSQPPYLIPMVKLYVDHTNDLQFVRDNIDQMERELNFWRNNRSTVVSLNGSSYSVAQYNSRVDEPRPESYREDLEVALTVPEANRTQLYVEYKSGAESGWDYSSRWFVNGASNKGSLKNLAVTAIAPVDLNSLLCYNARIISDYYSELGDPHKAATWAAIQREMQTTLTELFWDEQDGVWYDVNIRDMTKRRFFYLSNIHPLWTGCFDQSEGNAERVVSRVLDYLKTEKVLDHVGGVPTSTYNTGQQWDFPNAWAPLQHLIVTALQQNKHRHPELDLISFNLAQKWIASNWRGYVDVEAMFEKYNVDLVGAPGGGGEYDVQLGFGWTNGVAMRFLNDFGDRLTAPELPTGTARTPTSGVTLTSAGGGISAGGEDVTSAAATVAAIGKGSVDLLVPVMAAAAAAASSFLARGGRDLL